MYDSRPSFENFKSSICHRLKNQGDINFLIHTLETNEIRKLYDRQWHLESLYLMAMVDYISRENDLPLCTNYDDIRNARLQETVYPVGIIVRCLTSGSEQPKQDSVKFAIPEFMRHNIVESEVRDVV